MERACQVLGAWHTESETFQADGRRIPKYFPSWINSLRFRTSVMIRSISMIEPKSFVDRAWSSPFSKRFDFQALINIAAREPSLKPNGADSSKSFSAMMFVILGVRINMISQYSLTRHS